MADIEAIVSAILVAAGIGVLNATSGWSIHYGKASDSPDTTITITHTGYSQSSNPKWLLDYPSVQIIVRGSPSDRQAAKNKIIAIREALLGIPAADVTGGRIDGITEISGIAPLGFDAKQRPLFSCNMRIIFEPSSGTYRVPL